MSAPRIQSVSIGTKREFPFMEWSLIQEVAADDSGGKTAQTKAENTGRWPHGDHPADKAPVKDEPSTPTSEDAHR